MGRAKEIIVKVIPAKIANEFVKKHHYSGKVVPNSTLHFGCFLDDKLHGVMSYGCSMQKSSIIGLVQPCLWNEMLELNRMAFDEYLPKYSESRCISISIKLIKKNAPHIKWIISYADGCQCGDGTIYRASGFQLTGIKQNTTMLLMPNGQIMADKTLNNSNYKTKGQSAGYCSHFSGAGGRRQRQHPPRETPDQNPNPRPWRDRKTRSKSPVWPWAILP